MNMEDRIALLEKSIMSLNTLWKMSVIMQGPTFTDAAIKNLEAALSVEPNDLVAQDAKNDLEKAAELWKAERGGEFGLEHFVKKIEVIEARQAALQFISFLNILQQGPHSMSAMLHGIESRNMREGDEFSETFKESSGQVFSYFKKQIEAALEVYSAHEDEEVVHA